MWLICGAFAEERRDDIPGETARVETVDVVIAGELNEMLSSAWEEREPHLKSSGHICLLLADIYVFWGLLFTGNILMNKCICYTSQQANVDMWANTEEKNYEHKWDPLKFPLFDLITFFLIYCFLWTQEAVEQKQAEVHCRIISRQIRYQSVQTGNQTQNGKVHHSSYIALLFYIIFCHLRKQKSNFRA